MNVLDKALISIGNAVPRILGDLDPKAVIDGAESSISDGGKLSGCSEKVDDIGGGVYHIVYKIGIFVALVGIVWAGIKLITSNAGTREEAKSSIIYKVFGVILIAAAASIVIFLATAGKDLLD